MGGMPYLLGIYVGSEYLNFRPLADMAKNLNAKASPHLDKFLKLFNYHYSLYITVGVIIFSCVYIMRFNHIHPGLPSLTLLLLLMPFLHQPVPPLPSCHFCGFSFVFVSQ